MVLASSEEFRRTFLRYQCTGHLKKDPTPLNPSLYTPKIKSHLKQNICKWSCSEDNCNLSYTGESSMCLCNSHITSAIYQHCVSNNHPRTIIGHFKIIDQDNKQVAIEVREVIHIRISNPALNCSMGKMYIPEIFNNLLGADGSTSHT